jgi:hypothetical protein
MTDRPRVERGVTTSVDNPVTLAPYTVELHAPPLWDPSAGALGLSYDIHDPNARIRKGRIYYVALVPRSADGVRVPTVLKRQNLNLSQLRHACHELPQAECWDGNIAEGLTDRVGQRVTADLSPLTVHIAVWNEGEEPLGFSPAVTVTSQSGRQFVNTSMSRVVIDAIVEARWDTHWCIPYADPVEPAKGHAGMIVRVKNVREGTPVRFQVRRIREIADPSRDAAYLDGSEATQEDLPGAVVRGDRVLLADGRAPRVRFRRYEFHWPEDSVNNFYAFRMKFGDARMSQPDEYQVASERDYVNHERACLHMRFTVFISRPAGDLPEYTRAAQRLHRFFRSETKYYRSYLLAGPPRDIMQWLQRFRCRYIVILLGHAACGCYHPDHPQDRRGKFKDLYHAAFPPDGYVCPTALDTTPEARRVWREDPRGVAGCGHAEKVFHQNSLGRGSWLQNWISRTPQPLAALDRRDQYAVPGFSMPRLFFWNGGCRTMLTPALGQTLIRHGTGYYSGWVYSPSCDYGQMCYDFFTRWIRGTRDDPAPNEYTNSRVVPAFRYVAGRGTRSRYHPRVMDSTGVLNPRPVPGAVEDAAR